MTGEVIKCLPILGRVAKSARVGCGDTGTAAREQAKNADEKEVEAVELH